MKSMTNSKERIELNMMFQVTIEMEIGTFFRLYLHFWRFLYLPSLPPRGERTFLYLYWYYARADSSRIRIGWMETALWPFIASDYWIEFAQFQKLSSAQLRRCFDNDVFICEKLIILPVSLMRSQKCQILRKQLNKVVFVIKYKLNHFSFCESFFFSFPVTFHIMNTWMKCSPNWQHPNEFYSRCFFPTHTHFFAYSICHIQLCAAVTFNNRIQRVQKRITSAQRAHFSVVCARKEAKKKKKKKRDQIQFTNRKVL